MQLSELDKRIRLLSIPSLELEQAISNIIEKYNLSIADMIYILTTYQMRLAREGMKPDSEVI